MTPAELDQYRLEMRANALHQINGLLVSILRLQLANTEGGERDRLLTAYAKRLSTAQGEFDHLTVPNVDPAMSDLMAAEFQEAFHQACKDLEAQLREDLGPELHTVAALRAQRTSPP